MTITIMSFRRRLRLRNLKHKSYSPYEIPPRTSFGMTGMRNVIARSNNDVAILLSIKRLLHYRSQ